MFLIDARRSVRDLLAYAWRAALRTAAYPLWSRSRAFEPEKGNPLRKDGTQSQWPKSRQGYGGVAARRVPDAIRNHVSQGSVRVAYLRPPDAGAAARGLVEALSRASLACLVVRP